jgi:hypothetical protein
VATKLTERELSGTPPGAWRSSATLKRSPVTSRLPAGTTGSPDRPTTSGCGAMNSSRPSSIAFTEAKAWIAEKHLLFCARDGRDLGVRSRASHGLTLRGVFMAIAPSMAAS